MDLRLSTPAGELTRAEQKILDYINTNTDAFLFSSIGQLAQQLELSDATVSRFARHVGCRDFKALKALVMEQASGPAVKMAGTLQQEESFSPQSWLTRQQEYLEKTAQLLSTQEFKTAVEAICSARTVFLHGKNASAALAQLLHFRLRRVGVRVSLLPSGGAELLEGLIQAGPGHPAHRDPQILHRRAHRKALDRSIQHRDRPDPRFKNLGDSHRQKAADDQQYAQQHKRSEPDSIRPVHPELLLFSFTTSNTIC